MFPVDEELAIPFKVVVTPPSYNFIKFIELPRSFTFQENPKFVVFSVITLSIQPPHGHSVLEIESLTDLGSLEDRGFHA